MKPTRQDEQAAAERLVALLVERLRVPLHVMDVRVAANWKTQFTFVPTGRGVFFQGRAARYGRRPGLEIDWLELRGDVDAWQAAGDVVSTAMHGWQIFKKWITRKEERPSKLLRIAEKSKSAKVEMPEAG
jgi:hypothetical protein